MVRPGKAGLVAQAGSALPEPGFFLFYQFGLLALPQIAISSGPRSVVQLIPCPQHPDHASGKSWSWTLRAASGLAGLGPLSVLLAGWEVRPVRAFLGAVALILGGCAAAQSTRWEKPAQLKKLLCEIVSSAFNKLHW